MLVSPQIRAALKQITENHLPQLVVLSFNEITRDTKIVTLGIVSDDAKAESVSVVGRATSARHCRTTDN